MRLTTKKRKKLKKSQFAIPEKAPGPGSYPIPDKEHASRAIGRVKQFGTPTEKVRVRKAVCHRFPRLSPCLRRRL